MKFFKKYVKQLKIACIKYFIIDSSGCTAEIVLDLNVLYLIIIQLKCVKFQYIFFFSLVLNLD